MPTKHVGRAMPPFPFPLVPLFPASISSPRRNDGFAPGWVDRVGPHAVVLDRRADDERVGVLEEGLDLLGCDARADEDWERGRGSRADFGEVRRVGGLAGGCAGD